MYSRASWGPTDAEQSGEHDGKEGAAEPHAAGKMSSLVFGGARDEERVGGDGGGGDVGMHERARYHTVTSMAMA